MNPMAENNNPGFSNNPARLDQEFAWHPFTPMGEWCDPQNEPVILVEGRGAVLRDSKGREYLDGNSSIWTNLHGHRHPGIDAAIRAQLDKIAHVSYLGSGNEPASLLARKLISFFPENTLRKVFYSDNGSTAIEVAIKMTAQFHQQTGNPERVVFAAFDHAYHGDTAGAASLCGVRLFSDRFSAFHFPVERVESVAELEQCEAARDGRLAGVVIEPLVQGVNRVRLWPRGMLRDLRAFCDRTGAMLILDEVLTGFGRTGSMFACQQESVIPDFLCLAKGLTGGYLPLAATLTTRRVFDAFLGHPEEGRTFFYGHSYTGNALGCAAALASLEIFENEKTLERVCWLSGIFAEELARLRANFTGIGDVRQIGLIAGVDVNRPDGTAFAASERAGFQICRIARDFGLLTRNIGDTVILMPPFCTTPEQLHEMTTALGRAVSSFLQPASYPSGASNGRTPGLAITR